MVVFKFRADVVSVRINNNLLTLAPKQAATVLWKPVKGLTTDRPQDPLPPIPPFFLDPRVPSGVEGLRVRPSCGNMAIMARNMWREFQRQAPWRAPRSSCAGNPRFCVSTEAWLSLYGFLLTCIRECSPSVCICWSLGLRARVWLCLCVRHARVCLVSCVVWQRGPASSFKGPLGCQFFAGRFREIVSCRFTLSLEKK